MIEPKFKIKDNKKKEQWGLKIVRDKKYANKHM